jgi:hypothetical protein
VGLIQCRAAPERQNVAEELVSHGSEKIFDVGGAIHFGFGFVEWMNNEVRGKKFLGKSFSATRARFNDETLSAEAAPVLAFA